MWGGELIPQSGGGHSKGPIPKGLESSAGNCQLVLLGGASFLCLCVLLSLICILGKRWLPFCWGGHGKILCALGGTLPAPDELWTSPDLENKNPAILLYFSCSNPCMRRADLTDLAFNVVLISSARWLKTVHGTFLFFNRNFYLIQNEDSVKKHI